MKAPDPAQKAKKARQPMLTQPDLDYIEALVSRGSRVSSNLVRKLLNERLDWIDRAYSASYRAEQAEQALQPPEEAP